MLPILQIGPLSLQTPGLILILGLWLGLLLAERSAALFKVPAAKLYNLAFAILIAAVIGARLGYILRYPQAFLSSPASLVSLNPGLLDPWGALAAGLAVGLISMQRQNLPGWATLDALTPLLAVLSISWRLSNLASGSAYGAAADLSWSIELWGERRHPTQLYELAAATVILAILWIGWRKKLQRPPGAIFLSFTALSAGARLFLEAFRGDSLLIAGGMRLAQIVAWLVLAATFYLIAHLKIHTTQAGEADDRTHEL